MAGRRAAGRAGCVTRQRGGAKGTGEFPTHLEGPQEQRELGVARHGARRPGLLRHGARADVARPHGLRRGAAGPGGRRAQRGAGLRCPTGPGGAIVPGAMLRRASGAADAGKKQVMVAQDIEEGQGRGRRRGGKGGI